MKRQLPFFAAISCAIVSAYAVIQMALPVNRSRGADEFRVSEGMTFKQASALLEEKGYIRDARLFSLLGRLTGVHKRMQAGFYTINGLMSPWDIFHLFKSGKLIQTEVVIIEGDSLADIGQRLAANGFMSIEDFERLSADRTFLRSLGIDAPSLEGYLFPDTYRFPKGTSPEKILGTMFKQLIKLYGGELHERASQLGLSLNSVLTLASIIEKEARVDSERPLVAAVFYNRMKKGIPLQADPTAIYGIKPSGSTVSKSDLQRKTKYNTYIIKGLPPGPIASPGLKSIRAALSPAKVDYLYFVSNLDGTHTFSTTFAEHQTAVSSLRLKQKMMEIAGDGGDTKDEKKN